ncbi:MAG: hypothetical protein ACK40Y_07205 [Cloacibacterium caeni]
MKKLFLILVFVLSILSCNREDSPSIQEQILGTWQLDNISQRKDAVIINLQNGGASFEFSPSQLKISGNTILANSGVFSYEVKNENYFNSDLNEPKSNILKFNNQKFVIEVAESNNVQILILTNYSDGRIIYRFTK